MITVRLTAGSALVVSMAFAFQMGDARRGEELLRTQGCVSCHSFNGRGGTLDHLGRPTPDLGRLSDRSFTPAIAASRLWSHAPAMWAGMKKEKIAKSQLSTAQTSDLFAYLFAARGSDLRFAVNGDAVRGSRVFTEKGCARCHDDPASGAPKLSKGRDAYSDMTMVAAVWSHGPRMLEMMNQKNISWPRFSAREMTDLIAHLNSL